MSKAQDIGSSSPQQEDDDLSLFRDAVRDAVPLRAAERVRPAAPREPPLPIQSLIDDRMVLEESLHPSFDEPYEAGEQENYLAPGVGPDVLRKLRRGVWRVQAEVDLHGLTKLEAHAMLSEFMQQCAKRQWRCVRIVHGKGLGSKNREPVLKSRVRAWLAKRKETLAYCETPPAQGGSGALLVLLKG